jgi:hypothetical protein
MSLVTVVIPVYNAEHYVGLAVESVLRQSLPPRKIILVDDGSTDSTPVILRSFGSAIEVRRQNRQGVGSARNAGVLAADGDYVAFLDADDVWHVDKLAVYFRSLTEHSEANLFFSDAIQIDSGGRPLRRLSGKPQGDGTWESLLKDNWVVTSTAVVRRSAAHAVGLFRTDFQCPAGAEDWDFFLRMARAGPSVYVPGPWTCYRQHAASAIQGKQLRRLQEDSYRVVTLNAVGVSPSQRRQAYAMVWYNSGVRNLASLDTVSARRDFAMSLRSWPFISGAALLWIVSFWGGSTIRLLLKFRKWGLGCRARGMRGHFFVLPGPRENQK